jgi:hypothetical protein
MDYLFKNLPDVLQIDILCTYVGTHVMRNGKLRRRFDGKIQEKLLSSTIYDQHYRLYLKEDILYDERIISFFKEKPPCCYETYRIIAINIFSYQCNSRVLVEDRITGELVVWYKFNKKEWNYSILDDSIILLPFVKNQYLSWETTDKKKGIIWQKVVLYDPERSYLEFYNREESNYDESDNETRMYYSDNDDYNDDHVEDYPRFSELRITDHC